MKKEFKNLIAPNNKKYIRRDLTLKYFSNISKTKKELNEKIKEILEEEMNKECFDCGALNPNYISINNGIFLCNNCINVHQQFTNEISIIKDNNLSSLTNKEILYIYYGGNMRLNNFVNYEFPGLQNYQPNILYRTQAMNYYRNRLTSMVYKTNKPEKPNSVYAYKLIGENIDKYSKNRLLFENPNINNNKTNLNNANQNNGKNVKFIYDDYNNNKKRHYQINSGINFESSYQNNNINNTFNININQKENQKEKQKENQKESHKENQKVQKYKIIKRKKKVDNNIFDKKYNLYNNTFFEEMKNIFKLGNKKIKLRMKLNDKEEEK